MISRRQALIAAGAGLVASRARGLILMGGGAAAAAGFYPSGHWVTPPFPWISGGDQTAFQMYPRPDSETNAFARHRVMFYDGVTTFVNAIPIITRGGAFPYVYQLMAAPPGTYLGATYWQPNWTVSQALAAGYGMLYCQPVGSFSGATFWVRVWDQTHSYLDIIWTASTTSTWNATTGVGFVVLDPVNGVNPSSYSTIPSMSSPMKTMNWAFGNAQGDTTYPNAIIILRGSGATPLFAQDSTFGISIYGGHSPLSIIGFPNDPLGVPTLDYTSAGSLVGLYDFNVVSDRFFADFSNTGQPATSNGFRHIFNDNANPRVTANNLSFPNIKNGANPTSNQNSGALVFDSPGTLREYVSLRGITQTNAVLGGSVVYATAIGTFYGCRYLCLDMCTATNNGTSGFTIKGSNSDVTVRNVNIVSSSTGDFNCDFFDQTEGAGLLNNNRELCYCTLDCSLNPSINGMEINGSESAGAPAGEQAFGLTYSYRNTFVACPIDVLSPATPVSNGPFSSINDVVQYGPNATQAVYITRAAGSIPANVISSGTECQASASVVNASYSLIGSYASFNGQRGALIS